MKKLKLIILSFLTVSFITGCDTSFEETNTDPNNSTELPAHLLLGYSQRFYTNTIHGVLGGAGGDMGAIWAQMMTKVQYNDEERYVPRRGVMDGIWSNLYATVASEANQMSRLAVEEGNVKLEGVGMVMKALAMQTLTELFGPVPFTEALDGGNLQPVYDDEATVWLGVIDLYTQGANLIANGEGSITPSSDLWYGGDASQWVKLANTLKFRALMRASNVINVGPDLQALLGKMMTSNADNAELVFLSVAPDAWPFWETIVDGNRAEYKISELMVETLRSLNDDRLPLYAAKAASDGAYRGKPVGYGNATTLPNEALGLTYANISGLGSFYLKPTLPGVTMSFAQLNFLMAEAANEGLIPGGLAAANNYYKEGIKASFAWHGLDATDYLAQDGIDLTSQADGRTKIRTQSWISLFGQGYESWTEWRRTKIPALQPVIEHDPQVGSIPSRYYYPTTEPSFNKTNYDAAASSIGGDLLTSSLIWQK